MLGHDVLVIGAGLAGLRAALAASDKGADVAVATKVHPVRSHSNAAQGGINAALTHRGDNWEEHAFETVKGSDYLGDQDAIEVMCQEAGQAIIEQEHMGVIFNRDETGHLGTRNFGGQQRARTFFVADFHGPGHAPRNVRADSEGWHPRIRGVVRNLPCDGGRRVQGSGCDGPDDRQATGHQGQGRDNGRRGPGARL